MLNHFILLRCSILNHPLLGFPVDGNPYFFRGPSSAGRPVSHDVPWSPAGTLEVNWWNEEPTPNSWICKENFWEFEMAILFNILHWFVVSNMTFIFHNIWDNHPNWRTPSFFRGVGIPPTRYSMQSMVRFLLVNPPGGESTGTWG